MTEPNSPEPAHEPTTAAAATPDPAIAPGAPDPADPAPAVDLPQGRRVRYVGDVEQTVAHVGAWAAGEVKHVAGWLAERLLAHPQFVEAKTPTPDGEPTGEQDDNAGNGDQDDAAAAPAKPATRRRTSTSADDTAA